MLWRGATVGLFTVAPLIFAGILHHSAQPMSVGIEWIVDAGGCDTSRLRDPRLLRELLERIVDELGLAVVGEPAWNVFPGEGGVTGLLLLSESHLACHTYPEFGVATFNLYCCRERPPWPWAERLRDALGAATVTVRTVARGADASLRAAEAPVR
jgi:S-adenosylmethionine decarboxylase